MHVKFSQVELRLFLPVSVQKIITYFLISLLLFSRPTMEWYYLVAIGVLNAIGYIIFRASETQRCEFAKDPNSDSMKRKIFSRLLHTIF